MWNRTTNRATNKRGGFLGVQYVGKSFRKSYEINSYLLLSLNNLKFNLPLSHREYHCYKDAAHANSHTSLSARLSTTLDLLPKWNSNGNWLGCKTFWSSDLRCLGFKLFQSLLDDSVHFLFSKSFFWYAVHTNLFRLGSTNPKKSTQTLDAFQMSEQSIIVYLFGTESSICLGPKHPGGVWEVIYIETVQSGISMIYHNAIP